MGAFEYRQAEEIRDVFVRHGVRFLFIGKSVQFCSAFPIPRKMPICLWKKMRKTVGFLFPPCGSCDSRSPINKPLKSSVEKILCS